MSSLSYLLAAYAVVWIALFCYVFSLSVRMRRVQAELELLKEELKGAGAFSAVAANSRRPAGSGEETR